MSAPKRKLGTEWKDWNGKGNDNTDATVGLFLLMSFFVMVMFSFILIFGNLLIFPRLESIHPYIPLIVQGGIFCFIGLMILWILTLSISVLFNINFFTAINKKFYNVLNMVPHAAKLARRFGINRDRLGNSFIKLNNKIVEIRNKSTSPCDMLLLLPRCLSAEMHKGVREIAGKYQIKTFTLTGGEAARQKVKDHKPKAIIAVACERDLVAGIKDVPKNIPVYGIPNLRPDGPCINTHIDLRELERSIRLLIGSRS